MRSPSSMRMVWTSWERKQTRFGFDFAGGKYLDLFVLISDLLNR
jgi:hypothetical protein